MLKIGVNFSNYIIYTSLDVTHAGLQFATSNQKGCIDFIDHKTFYSVRMCNRCCFIMNIFLGLLCNQNAFKVIRVLETGLVLFHILFWQPLKSTCRKQFAFSFLISQSNELIFLPLLAKIDLFEKK